MGRWLAASVATVLASAGLVVGLPPASVNAAGVVNPTQWVMKQSTELVGRIPTGSEWNFWMAYYNANGCSTSTLATLGKAAAESSEFLNDYPEATDKASRVLALVRAVYNHEPNSNDWSAYYTPYANGSKTWNQIVDTIYGNGVFSAYVVPSICNASNPGYGFGGGNVPDLLAWSGGGVSRTQAQLQQALNGAASSCGTVALQPTEVVRIGGTQPSGDPQNNPLRIPACVTLTTAGGPPAARYAKMGRLVSNGLICDAPWLTCDHIEMVRMADGAGLSNVWVDGNGALAGARIGLVGTASGQSPARVDDDRLSDPPAGGTAVRVTGYGTTGVDCANRDISRNLVTGYSSRHAQSRLGAALWVDGLEIFCEQATVQSNGLADVSGDGIAVYGSWNAEAQQLRTQHSTVSGNHVVSAGNSSTVAFGLDGTGECNALPGGLPAGCIQFSDNRSGATAERSFAGTSLTGNTFWTGPRTAFDIALMIGDKTRWGDNGPYARGASVTNNTVDGVTGTRVNTGIAISGMYDTTLTGNTPTYTLVDTQPTVDQAGKCQQGNVLYGYYVGTLTPGSQAAVGTSIGIYQCLAPPPPVGGLENIVVGPNQTLVGASSGQRFTPWGQNYVTDTVPIADLREMKEMGANVVRLHLQFRTFMIDCATANQAALDQLAQTLRAAEQNAIYLDLTGLGSYAGDEADPSCYGQATTDAQRWGAQAAFWNAVARTVANSPAVLTLDLVNEPIIPGSPEPAGCGWADCPGDPFPGYFFNQVITQDPAGRTSDQIATAWINQMTGAIRQYDTAHLITLGCLPFYNCAGFSPATTAPLLGYLSVHIYPQDCTGPPPPPGQSDPCAFERPLERPNGVPGDPLAFEKNLLSVFAAPGKPVVVEETGVLTPTDLERNFILQSRPHAVGWIGQWGTTTISQRLASGNIGDALYAAWGQLFQDMTHVVAPCGTCEP